MGRNDSKQQYNSSVSCLKHWLTAIKVNLNCAKEIICRGMLVKHCNEVCNKKKNARQPVDTRKLLVQAKI